MKKTGPQNPELKKLIRDLKKLSNKQKVKIWKKISKDLQKPTHKRSKVNLYKINMYIKENEIAIIPGKVLSIGNLEKNNIVAAYQFSKAAKEKLGNKAITIQELIKQNPNGKKVRILG